MDILYVISIQHWSTYDNVIVVESRGKGSVNIELCNNGNGKIAFIYNLYVCEECRSQGIATTLLKKAEMVAKSKGYDEVCLDWKESVSPNWVLEWYLRNGYEKSSSGKECFRLRKGL